MPNLSPIQQEINNELSAIRHLIYGRDPSFSKDQSAVDRLIKLAEQRIPNALMLQAVLIWHGYGFQQDPDKAYALATEAAELGEMEAFVVLASMHFVGSGCEQNFEKSLDLLDRFNNEASSIPNFLHIGEVGPSYFDFRTEFIFNLNGQSVVGPIDALEELNRWIFSCKRKCIARQAEILEVKPAALGGTTYRNLPFKGSIGGSCFSLKGKDLITHVGFHNDWLEEVIWFESNRLNGWPEKIGFDGLTEFNNLPETELREIRKCYLTNKHKGKGFELKMIGSSVHRETKLFCGDDEVLSAYED